MKGAWDEWDECVKWNTSFADTQRSFGIFPESLGKWKTPKGAFHLVKNSENSCSGLNGKRFFGSPDWKIPRKSGTAQKVVPFSRLERPNGNLCSIYRISRLYHQLYAFRGLFKWPGFPGLSRVSKKWRLIRVRFLEAFCKQTSGLLRVLSACHVQAPYHGNLLQHECASFKSGR